MLRIGHKGADALVPGNTIESFERAVEVGVDLIELDALWSAEHGEHIVAHDREAAASRPVLTLAAALDAFNRSPLDQVEIDIDIKGRGREDAVVGAITERGLAPRLMVSGLDLPAIDQLEAAGTELRLGWTVPQVRRNRDRIWTRRPFLDLAMIRLRRQMPALVAAGLRGRRIHAVWAHHQLITTPLVDAVHDHGALLMAWTVDNRARVASLRDLGVDGICSNDPRLLQH